jgi:hypothetical protein
MRTKASKMLIFVVLSLSSLTQAADLHEDGEESEHSEAPVSDQLGLEHEFVRELLDLGRKGVQVLHRPFPFRRGRPIRNVTKNVLMHTLNLSRSSVGASSC